MNLNSFKTALAVFFWLLWCDVRLFLKDWKDNVLNNIIWPIIIIAVNAFVLPALGMPESYGIFSCVGMIIIMASFMSWSSGNALVSDLEGPRSITYDLTLPITYWLVYIKNILQISLKSMLYSLCSLLVGVILLYHSFDFSQFSVAKFILIYGIANLFFGAFTMWAVIYAHSTQRYTNIELRIAGPLFFVCGYTASWQVLYSVAPTIAHILLATPWIYAYEGTRAAILGQEGYLSYWICALMLLVFAAIFTSIGIYSFKKHLDCV